MTREVALRKVRGYLTDYFSITDYNEVEEIMLALERQPKTVHWIFCEGIKGKDNVEKCSCCQSHWKEAVIYRNDTQEYLRLRLKHCPNCGADMRESEG